MAKKRVKYPIGEQSFRMLREGGFLYVDKTQYIEELIEGSKYYFLSRPRRFGKSLFLSTLRWFFEGRRDLFKGLYIDSIEWDWVSYPVLHLDLNIQQYQEDDDLEMLIEGFLSSYEEEYDIVAKERGHSVRFANLLRTMAEKTGKGVVILVDEYDKPLVNNIQNPERFVFYWEKLASLYSNFKSAAEHIRLVFLTGVSRFGKFSVFSGLNNIRDITFNNRFSAICGITDEELKHYFQSGIERLGEEYDRTFDEELTSLKKWYDGYHFSERSPDIYNPFSLLQVFADQKYRNYWIESGTPRLLADQLKKTDANISDILNRKCGQNELSGLDIDTINLEALFYQTGYLTIKDYDPETELYTLGLPNLEVRQGFFEYLLPYYSSIKQFDTKVFVVEFRREMEAGLVDDFLKRMQSMFAGIGYDLQFDEERNVQNAMLILFSLIGIKTDAEVHTSDGRIDILVRTKKYIYIMELKYDSSPEEALAQIERKEYSLPWAVDDRDVIEIGINYSSQKRWIDGWRIKR